MPLDEYWRKRDFSKTPEPRGSRTTASRKRPGLFFCVQKHLASHLHYDFRLEHNGVLLSWAVPKGPSLDPKTKRLAMQTEDHPLEYGTFEGVIPEGYGAGIVMLWDQGTWTPQSDDVDAALKKGDLKFTLDGFKLKGSWVLVRTGGRWAASSGGARSWLLIKHRDEWSGELDITEFAPRSVKSDGDFEDILAADQPEVWVSNRPAKTGEAGAMLAKIIERAARLKAERTDESSAKHRREAARSPVRKGDASGRGAPRAERKAPGGRKTATGMKQREPAARTPLTRSRKPSTAAAVAKKAIAKRRRAP